MNELEAESRPNQIITTCIYMYIIDWFQVETRSYVEAKVVQRYLVYNLVRIQFVLVDTC